MANEDTLLPTQMFSRLPARATFVADTGKFCVRDTKYVSDFVQKYFVSATNVSQFAQRKKHHGQQCVHNNVSWFAWAFKAETQDATNRGDKSPRLHCCCDKSLALSLSLRYVAQIQTSLNLCDRSQRQNSVAATMIFTCYTRRFVAATSRGDVSQRFVASCVSALYFSSLYRG